MDNVIVIQFHYGAAFINDPVPSYVGERGLEIVNIDKDHFSLFELLFYTKQLGYETLAGFYYKKPKSKDFVLLIDLLLLDVVKDLKDCELLGLYVWHEVGEIGINSQVAREENLQGAHIRG